MAVAKAIGNLQSRIGNVESQARRMAGPIMIELIRTRTRLGNDVNDAPFVPYSTRYARDKGRRSPVDLYDAKNRRGQHMLDGLRWLPTASGVTVYVAGAGNQALFDWHSRGAGRLPVRDTFGLSPNDLRLLFQRVTVPFNQRFVSGGVLRREITVPW